MSDKPRPMRELPALTPQERIAVRTLTRQRAEALFVLDREVKQLVCQWPVGTAQGRS